MDEKMIAEKEVEGAVKFASEFMKHTVDTYNQGYKDACKHFVLGGVATLIVGGVSALIAKSKAKKRRREVFTEDLND